LDKDVGGPKEAYIRQDADAPMEGAIFRGCPGHSKALAIFAAAIAAMFAAKGIIQLPITSCSRRDH